MSAKPIRRSFNPDKGEKKMYTSEYDIKKAILQVLCDVDSGIWRTFHPNFAEDYSGSGIDDIYECKCAILKGEYMFWLNVAALNGTHIEPAVTVCDYFRDRLAEPVRDLRLLAYIIQQNEPDFDKYREFGGTDERKHWYNAYAELLKINDAVIIDSMERVAKYLCDTVDNLHTRRMIYHSNFYESIALDYAYRSGNVDTARKILYLGYDSYLSVGTLAILYRHDKDLLVREMDNLKEICLERIIEYTEKDSHAYGKRPRMLYGDAFCDDMHRLATSALASLRGDPGANAHRFIKDRNTPEWAR